ncbi:DNA polymerase I [Terriglobus roseus DSM 18391]|uniref:DNA polymerase I n=1 Tax=Terriglobus roseus (strain DSM 18391 / NRRL B-41598 / KBS 63) TaxID=926566 RepID=I3ZEW9_TERRK|nr:DNA polymerase I [Terriglobus roseus]AFL87787.1 DNA polymerase I [Terriglobus roseus DSM 18391]
MPTEQKPPVYLLDTMAFVFRAYHAMQRSRPMSTRTGIPTAATYVFINMINKLRQDFAPHYLAAIYEGGAPVHRNEAAAAMKTIRKFNIKTQQFDEIDYAGYKATRSETPPDLTQQQPYIRRALEAFGIPILHHEGFEADDVIGTLSRRLSEEGYPVYIVSSDKDMMQLVTEHVKILNPTKDNLILDPAKVEEVLGVPPRQVIDVMALRGDSIDNIPGAPGIGDKGSVELIQQWGSVEAALDHADEIKKKTYRESLQNNRDTVMLSKELVTIHCNLPVDYSIEAMSTGDEPNLAELRSLYTELEFTTLLKDLPSPEAAHVDYILKPTAADITALLEAAAQPIKAGAPRLASETWDPAATELAGLTIFFPEDKQALAEESGAEAELDPEAPAEDPIATNMDLFGSMTIPTEPKPFAAPQTEPLPIGITATADTAMLLDLRSDLAEPIRKALADPAIPKTVHDLKAVLRTCELANLPIANVRDDVMLYSYLVNPTHGSHKLSDVAARFNDRALTVVEKKQIAPEHILPEAAAAVFQLKPILKKQIAEGELDKTYNEIDLPLVPVLLRMEKAGVRIDSDLLRQQNSRLAVMMDDLASRIHEMAGMTFNINSPKQLGEVLFGKMELPKPMKYGKGKVVSTAQDVLEELAEHHEAPRLVLEYRQLAKLRSNYTEQLPQLADAEGRVHTTFNQVGTATGRLSSTQPNLQNIPVRTELGRGIRAAFIAAPGNVILSADYSQIELRLMAHFSQDPLLLHAYRNDIDIHTLTASEVFGVDPVTMSKETRARAKAVNFGIVYGISPFGLAAQLGIDQKEARTYIETYFDRYKGVQNFINETLATVRETGKVTTLFGRSRPIPDIQSRNPNMRGFAERTAVNTPLQGTAADMIKVAMLRIDQALRDQKLATRMTLQVHDELLFDAPEAEAATVTTLVKHEMESVLSLSIPIVAEVGKGPNWRDAK